MKRHLDLPHAQLSDLTTVHQFVDAFVQDARVDEATAFALRLAIEEVFVNLVHHGYRDQPGLIDITLDDARAQVNVMIHDFSPPFPPDNAPRPDLLRDWRARPLGGLGWHFIREMMDEINYASDAKEGNVLTLVKWLK